MKNIIIFIFLCINIISCQQILVKDKTFIVENSDQKLIKTLNCRNNAPLISDENINVSPSWE